MRMDHLQMGAFVALNAQCDLVAYFKLPLQKSQDIHHVSCLAFQGRACAAAWRSPEDTDGHQPRRCVKQAWSVSRA